MNPETLRRYADGISGGWGPGMQPEELAAWLRDVADAMDAPLEVTTIDARRGTGKVTLHGTVEQAVAVARRSVLYTMVALVPVGGGT